MTKPVRPSAPPRALRSDPSTFSANAEGEITYQFDTLPNWMDTLGDFVDLRADEANSQAVVANQAAENAGTSASNAATSATASANSATASQSSATASANSATASANSATASAASATAASDSADVALAAAATVDFTGVAITGGTIDGTVIGGSTPAAISGTTGSFTSVTGTAVTQSATDATDGRLMKVGDFGLGSSQLLLEGDQDAIPTSRFFRTDPNTANRAGNFVTLGVTLKGAFSEELELTGRIGADKLFYRRSTGVFEPYREVYMSSTILGTVSQSAGVPTGAIIQRGSNANGEFVRFADGTQICSVTINLGSVIAFGSGTYDSPFRTDQSNWSFPASFASQPVLQTFASITSSNVIARAVAARASMPSTTGVVNLQAIRITSSSADQDAEMMAVAIGRWF